MSTLKTSKEKTVNKKSHKGDTISKEVPNELIEYHTSHIKSGEESNLIADLNYMNKLRIEASG